ncbi:uncharacterized protein IUM83_19845 [Phytophthora cinnamomi]|uniref:uncharacterized protein n=1 Tax=Phytophthora cinnamomi TaxID=4785 RepID=UPI00355A23ED|nr:hypothetical protein IUM83_19845 [Phytophthora cinnamomi]
MSSGGEDSDSSQPADGSAVFPAPSAQQDLSGALDWSGALGSGWLAQPSLQEQAPSMQNDSTTQEHLVGAPRMQTDSLQEGTSVQEEQEDPPPQPKARRGGSKRGRPPKGKDKAPFVWTEDRIEHLLKIRFRALQDRFDNAKSNQQVKECWDLLTAAVGTKIGENIDSEQCKNKLKHMKRLWDAYNNDLQQTGNAGPLDDPPCLGLMRDLWADKDAFNSEPFISSCPSSTSAARRASTDDGATTVNRVSEVGTDTPAPISSPNSSPSIGVSSSITSTMRVSVGTTTTSPAPPKTAHASRQSTKNTKQPRKKAKDAR